MFFEIGMRQTVVLKPWELLEDSGFFQKTLVARLLEDVNKLGCTQERGHIVAVTTISEVSDGRIRPDTGSVVYQVEFNAIVCYLHRREVVEALVIDVGKRGCSTTSGPCPIFLPVQYLVQFQFRQGVDASSHSFRGTDGADIRIGSIVRVEICSRIWNTQRSEYQYIGTMARDFCGLSPGFDEFGEPIRLKDSPAAEWEAADENETSEAADTEDGVYMQVDEKPPLPDGGSGGKRPLISCD